MTFQWNIWISQEVSQSSAARSEQGLQKKDWRWMEPLENFWKMKDYKANMLHQETVFSEKAN